MGEVEGPLQKYAVRLGRTIKIIECEVDPDAAACIINHNSKAKTEKFKSYDHKDEEEFQGEPSLVTELESSAKSIKTPDGEEKTPNNGSDDAEHITDSIETAEYLNTQTQGESSQISNVSNSLAAAACCSTSGNIPSESDSTAQAVSNEVIDKEPKSLQNTDLLVKSELLDNDEIQMDAVLNEDNDDDDDDVVDRLDDDITLNIADQINDSDDFVSVSEKLPINNYSKDEWKGGTYKAECMRAGYNKIANETHCTNLRRIRGDNYCGIRAAAFQCLSQNLNIFSSLNENIDDFVNIPQQLLSKYNCDWLMEWTFAERIPSTAETKLFVMKDCLSYLVEQVKITRSLPDDDARNSHFSAIFNSGTNKEIYLFEALKLLMLFEAVKLHKQDRSGEEVPIFAWLLFARDTSDSPKNLMINHLNSVGESGGLEQVEMCLLGYVLQVTINVFRPSKSDQEDFISFYPDDKIGKWDNCFLVAEDDRHYNIVTV